MPIKDFFKVVQDEQELLGKPAPYNETSRVLAYILKIYYKISVEKSTLAYLITSFKARKKCLLKDQVDKFAKDKAPDNLDDTFKYKAVLALAKARSSTGSSKVTNVLADYAVKGKNDPSKVTSRLRPWATKISVLSEADKLRI
ncbi:hypothetical protein ColKHC_06645 [Colletotrichum higginsianum]|nr:hypothetical protein ColKHC_06645 [Colletotrichum higginsianum]